MANGRGTLICLSVLALSLMLAPNPASGQDISVAVLCDPNFDVTDVTIPPDFPGVYYGTLSGYGPSPEPYRFIEVTATGVQERSAPAALEQISPVIDPTLSPEGRYMAFRPLDGTDLVVWEIATDALATLALPAEVAESLGINRPWAHPYGEKLTWTEPNRMRLRQLEEDPSYLVRPLREIEVVVVADPLRLEIVSDRTIVYPDLPQPPNSSEFVIDAFSPDENYISTLWYADTLINGPFYLQIYDAQTSSLVFDFPPDFSLHARDVPFWAPDGSLALIPAARLDAEAGRPLRLSYLELRFEAGGIATNTLLEQALIDTFGPETSYTFLPPVWDAQGQRAAFIILGTSQHMRYIVVYSPQARALTAICDENDIARADTLRSFWSPDGRYVGYWDLGKTLIFDTQTGEAYRIPNEPGYFPFIGWVEGAREE